MNKKPSIAIAIPTLNEEKNIKRCLDSIFKQDWSGKIEVLVVDGGSTDRTLEIAKKYPVHVLYDRNRSLLHQKMIGFQKAETQYFTYLDADIDIPSRHWLKKMIAPLTEDSEIIATFTGYTSMKGDPAINRYLTIDPIQRDPLFAFLTPNIESTIIEKRRGYVVCRFSKGNIVPQGMCFFRTKELKSLGFDKSWTFHELDNLVRLVKLGKTKFGYVSSVAVHHLTLLSIRHLIRKRMRNVLTMFFAVGKKRYWTWIDTTSPFSAVKLAVWILYAETLIGPLIVGLVKSLKYRTWVGFYEPIVTWITTNATIYWFLKTSQGRNFVKGLVFKK